MDREPNSYKPMDTRKAWNKGFHDEKSNGPNGKKFRFTPYGTNGSMAEAYREGRKFAACKENKSTSGGYLYMFE